MLQRSGGAGVGGIGRGSEQCHVKFARGNCISLSHVAKLTILVSSHYQGHALVRVEYLTYILAHIRVTVRITVRAAMSGSGSVQPSGHGTAWPCVLLHLHISPPIYIKVGSMHSAYSAIKSYYYIYKMTMSSCLRHRDGSEQGRQCISIRPRRETNINVHEGAVYMRYSA